uniref:Uncharacterized protein n=1 Tax=Solanum tuberosum TaxID=4113 RepID=M1C8M2_SOLTU
MEDEDEVLPWSEIESSPATTSCVRFASIPLNPHSSNNLDMAEHVQIRIIPSRSSRRAKGQCRRARRRRTCFRGREIIRIGVSRATHNLLRNQRVIRRKRDKDLKEFMSLKMEPLHFLLNFLRSFVMKFDKVNESVIQVEEWDAYDVLYHFLLEYWKIELNETYFESGDNESLWKYVCMSKKAVDMEHIDLIEKEDD